MNKHTAVEFLFEKATKDIYDNSVILMMREIIEVWLPDVDILFVYSCEVTHFAVIRIEGEYVILSVAQPYDMNDYKKSRDFKILTTEEFVEMLLEDPDEIGNWWLHPDSWDDYDYYISDNYRKIYNRIMEEKEL